MRRILLLGAAALLAAAPAHALRVATWNLTSYQNGLVPSVITPRQAYFRTVVAAMNPDVIIAQEIGAAGAVDADSFRVGVLDALWPGQWQSSLVTVTNSAVFWRTSAVSVTNVLSFNTRGPRAVLQCWVHPVGYSDKSATFRLYSIHFKAGTTASDSTTRTNECTDIRNAINATNLTNYGPNFLLGGDTNFQGGFETGYTRLTESQANNNGQCRDTLRALNASQPAWHDNWYWRWYHTQAPAVTPPASYLSGGGLDDRFDVFLTSNSMQDQSGLDLHGYVTFGQDGRHMNDDINASGNDSVGYTVATAMRSASDHIPVIAVLRVPPILSTVSQLDFGTVITGATAQQDLSIANVAAWPADSLRYGFTAPGGFGAPAGSFAQAVGDPAASHTITMSTASAGALGGALAIATNNPDTTSKSVLLSGLVLRHAEASLDSLSAVTEAPLDFGDVPLSRDTTLEVVVHNRGWDGGQARLALTSAEIRGADARYSLLDFAPTLVSGTGARFHVRFDASCSGNVEAVDTLVFHSSDESLPGGTPLPDVRYLTNVRVTGVNPGVPTVLRFYPPQPNPSAGAFRFAWDLPRTAPVRLEVFDLSGRRLATVAAGEIAAGHHEVSWSPRASLRAAGLCFARFRTPGLARTVRLVLLP